MMQKPTFKNIFLYLIPWICILACIADFSLVFVFGNQIPGYNQLTDSISSIGRSNSPVAFAVMIWSVFLGIVLIAFGFGFGEIFDKRKKVTRNVFWLIVLYGFGEGIISGIFKNDTINGDLTISAYIHEIIGGIGVVAIIILPLATIKVFTKANYPIFFRFSRVVFLIGIVSVLLFSFRIEYFNNTFLNTYSGIWQRIFLFNSYCYFIVIALLMVKRFRVKASFLIN